MNGSSTAIMPPPASNGSNISTSAASHGAIPMMAAPVGVGSNLHAYQQQLQASQGTLGQHPSYQGQSPVSSQQGHQAALSLPSSSSSISASSIAMHQQQLLLNRQMESQNQLQLDKSRVTLLLEINAELLRETVNLQSTGKSLPTQGEEKTPDKGFYECMRRLQCNLAYLAAIADRSHKPASQVPPSPNILVPPPDMPVLQELYKKLQALYPGVKPTNPPTLEQQRQQNANNNNQGGSQSGRGSQNASPKVTAVDKSTHPQTPQTPQHPQHPQMQQPQQSPRHVASPTPPAQLTHQLPQQQQQQPMQHQQNIPNQHMQAIQYSPQNQGQQQNPVQHNQPHMAQQQQQQHQQHQSIPPNYAHLQQQRHAMMQAQAQVQGRQMQAQMSGIPSSMSMNPGVVANMSNGIPVTSMGQQPGMPQQAMMGSMAGMGMGMGTPGMAPGMGAPGMGMGMGNMSPVGMGGMPMGMGGMNMGMGNMGNMGVMGAGMGAGMGPVMGPVMGQPGFQENMGQGMWGGGWPTGQGQ